jgi:hypothetical protein
MDKKVVKVPITMHLEINILENGWKIKNMVMESYNIKMGQFMMANGLMINQQIKDK